MKKTISAILFFCTLQLFGQENDLALTVIVPESSTYLSGTQLQKLQTKMTQLVNANGMAAVEYSTNFVIYPIVNIEDESVVEGGMQNIYVTTLDVVFNIKQLDNNLMFGSWSKSIKGSGKNKDLAISNAISQLQASDAEFKSFILGGKKKLVDYYVNNCSKILEKADFAAQNSRYDEAIALLNAVPQEAQSCYKSAQTKALSYYKKYQANVCGQKIQDAKIELAGNNYMGVLNTLRYVDVESPCGKEVQSLMTQAASKVDAEEKKQFDVCMMIYKDEIALEKMRIDAVKEIGKAYYANQPKTITYNNNRSDIIIVR
jgi:hypothetical protein